MSGRLIEAQDEERKRIARNVHDDYSQRLAMLAIDIEKLEEIVGDTSQGTKQKLVSSSSAFASWVVTCILYHTNCTLPRLQAWDWLQE